MSGNSSSKKAEFYSGQGFYDLDDFGHNGIYPSAPVLDEYQLPQDSYYGHSANHGSSHRGPQPYTSAPFVNGYQQPQYHNLNGDGRPCYSNGRSTCYSTSTSQPPPPPYSRYEEPDPIPKDEFVGKWKVTTKGAWELCKALKAAYGTSEHSNSKSIPSTVDQIMDAAEKMFSKQTSLKLNDFKPESSDALTRLLQRPGCKIKDMTLLSTKTSCDWTTSLAKALISPYCRITSLSLWGEHVNVIALADSLKSPYCKVTKLHLVSDILNEDAISIADTLRIPLCNVSILWLIGGSFDERGATAIADSLKSPYCKVENLRLTSTNLTDDGAIPIAKSLENPSCKVRFLRLCFSHIGDHGATVIADSLESANCRLEHLSLTNNRIGNKGAKALAKALKNPNCKLEILHLERNRIGGDGAMALMNTQTDDNKIELNLEGNDFKM